jgi:hypothetical protein
MARWKITAFVNSSVGVQTYEIDSSTSYGAVELVKTVYQVKQIYKVQEVSPSQDSGSSELSADGVLGLAVFAFLVWLFVVATPIVLMVGFGTLGTRVAELAFGTRLPHALENASSSRGQGVVLWILAGAILCGGVGFYLGDRFQKHYAISHAGWALPSAAIQAEEPLDPWQARKLLLKQG